ncbi:MAG: tetratricopeptide repeat protein, partial [Spirochaetales bacterium]|nr:tetratricopeptide repeat protein [Spirochaetales bacterium]
PEIQLRNTYLEKAEFYYRRAIELKNNYVDALFGLSVLYVFEMNKPGEAKPLLEEALLYSGTDIQVMFLLARVYAELGDVDAAVALYEKIAETTEEDSQRREAEDNKRRLLDEYYGS